MCNFSKYILRKTKTFIKERQYDALDRLVLRLKKRGDVALFFWFLDNHVTCPPKIWEKVFTIFRSHVDLFPIQIRPI